MLYISALKSVLVANSSLLSICFCLKETRCPGIAMIVHTEYGFFGARLHARIGEKINEALPLAVHRKSSSLLGLT